MEVDASKIRKIFKRYKLSRLDVTRLITEYEIAKLKVEFSAYKVNKERIGFYDALFNNSDVKKRAKHLSESQMRKFVGFIKSIDQNYLKNNKEKVIIEIMKCSNYTKNILKHNIDKSCFTYTINKNNYAHIHFSNAVVPKNPFKRREYEKRKMELNKIAEDIKQNHPNTKRLISSTWIRNYKFYTDLFPKKYENGIRGRKDEGPTHMGYWGQFYRHDGTFNHRRAIQFRENWKFPLKPLQATYKIDDFFKMYL